MDCGGAQRASMYGPYFWGGHRALIPPLYKKSNERFGSNSNNRPSTKSDKLLGLGGLHNEGRRCVILATFSLLLALSITPSSAGEYFILVQ